MTTGSSEAPFFIKGEEVAAGKHVKLLGVTMDEELRYKEHIAATAARGFTTAMDLMTIVATSGKNTVPSNCGSCHELRVQRVDAYL